MKTCDDCTQEYVGPAYYTFPEYECRTSDRDGQAKPHRGCTGNLCPRCAGPDLEPDRPDDPRRPIRECGAIYTTSTLGGQDVCKRTAGHKPGHDWRGERA